MRVNVYAEEMTDRIEIIAKKVEGNNYTALRFYLELPVTTARLKCEHCNGVGENSLGNNCRSCNGRGYTVVNVSGPFEHRPGDDDSSAITFWGKKDLRILLQKAIELLDKHYNKS